ncbi:MAG: VOC family protein [Candidatus Riflebacteria bacterium]|nr:VOC family protein [Candidatus Riflebacteria bacterium]
MMLEKMIDYIEIPTSDIEQTKKFFAALMGWEFEDFGPAYTCFSDGRMKGGFYESPKKISPEAGSILLVFSAPDLEAACTQVRELGGKISKDIFSFPGGRRFHFTEPCGNEFAFWSE